MSTAILTFPPRAPAPSPRGEPCVVLILPVARIERCEPETPAQPRARRGRFRLVGRFGELASAIDAEQNSRGVAQASAEGPSRRCGIDSVPRSTPAEDGHAR